MTGLHCSLEPSADNALEMSLLIQADLDGALGPAEAARVAAHLERCPACTALQARLLTLSTQVRAASLYHPAPADLRHAIQTRIATLATPAPARLRWRPRALLPAGAAITLAAMLLLAIGLPHTDHDTLTDSLVASHIRALQPGHLMDVASTDQHTVKPWFDGRLDFAPPVKELKAEGFPLTGARIDYVATRPVAALVYQRRQHVIDLFVWPAGTGSSAPPPTTRTQNGYNVRRWTADAMEFSAVSDLEPQELATFAGLISLR